MAENRVHLVMHPKVKCTPKIGEKNEHHSMFKDDIHEVPRFTDGTIITAKDLADMNLNALDNIAELIGFELDE